MADILTLTLNPAIDLTIRVAELAPGEVNRVTHAVSHAAGKGINVAQALTDLGHGVTVGGLLGAANADAFDALFAERGWDDAFVRVAGTNRSNIKVIEEAGRTTELNSPGFGVTPAQADGLIERLARLADRFDVVVVAGSLPPGLTPDWFYSMLRRLLAVNPRIVIDTSGPGLVRGLQAGPWLVKPNTVELEAVIGFWNDAFVPYSQTGHLQRLNAPTTIATRPSEQSHTDFLAHAARLLHAGGIAHVVVSDGANGVGWWSAAGEWHSVPPIVSVRSTVGAGDSLLAGMIDGLLRVATPDAVLRRATACGTYAVTQVGFGLQDHAALAALAAGVTVRHVAPSTTHL
jgi:1-phosphofructokinase